MLTNFISKFLLIKVLKFKSKIKNFNFTNKDIKIQTFVKLRVDNDLLLR